LTHQERRHGTWPAVQQPAIGKVLQPGHDEEVPVTTLDGPASSLDVGYRPARPDDAPAVAALHADSWRRNYRGAYLDSFLDGDVFADRLAVWTDRLSAPGEASFTIVADYGGAVVGLAHVVLDEDPDWGRSSTISMSPMTATGRASGPS
jgi:hypothetical protein